MATNTDRPALSSVEDLKAHPSLFYHLQVFLYDLKHFRSDECSKARLEMLCDATFIGEPYFNQEEATLIKCFPVDKGGQDLQTELATFISDKLKRREESNIKDFEICAAHDLAPILEKTFGIRGKDLQGNKAFKKQLRKDGLNFVGAKSP